MQNSPKIDISKKVPVVFAADDQFIIPAYVAVWSMLKNSSADFFMIFIYSIPKVCQTAVNDFY